ncbi:ScbA/BarX family gamma-butyrolactone biosynthesis protein [Streptomyces sp. NPDC101776]|uniref:ScbA/BarX family gamma-butyrolactone biosynthesis protein n=1 Tax=Streptomyces sp. NPDC101776 TaxID=3366146 RepID=UPI0038260130
MTASIRQQLAFVRPIPRHLVHRASVAEVYLTDAVAEGQDRFLVAAQWPRDHALYYPDGNGCVDPLLFVETIRQALVYLAHQYYEVPLTHRFVGRDMDFEITDPDLLKVGATPLPVVLEVAWAWTGHRPPQRYGMRIEAVLTVGDVPCARGSLRVVAVDEKRYGLLRRRGGLPAGPGRAADRAAQAERLPAHQVGRLRAKDSVLKSAGRPGEWDLELDLGHAILFDHPTDHVPLMVLLEGFRQLGYLQTTEGDAAVPHTLTGASMDCLAFAELDAPIRLVMTQHRLPADAGSPALLRVEAVQSGVLLSTVSMSWAAGSRAPAAAPGLV